MVAVRQVTPGWRMRIPFTLPPSAFKRFADAAMTEAGAHAFFDLVFQQVRELSCAEVEAWLARYEQGGSA
jgi:hypothetical protein